MQLRSESRRRRKSRFFEPKFMRCCANAPCVIGFRSVQVEAIRTGSHPSGGWLVSGGFCITPRKGSIQDYAARVESVSIWTLLDTGLRVSEPCSLAPHQVLWQQESPCASGKGGPYGKQPKERKGRVVVPAGAPQILD